MRRITTVITVSILVIIVALFTIFVFDWGRREQVLNNVPSTTEELPIEVFSPKNNQEVTNPIVITGKARGNWYFEAVFPIDLVNSDGEIIAAGHASADSDWMTTDFVNFHAYINYSNATNTGAAVLVIKKDNPSDNPEFDRQIFVPVILK